MRLVIFLFALLWTGSLQDSSSTSSSESSSRSSSPGSCSSSSGSSSSSSSTGSRHCKPESKPEPPTCPTNETYVENLSKCEYDCRNSTALTPTCPPFTGCMCDDGYVRNFYRQCIKREDCPVFNCGENEYYNDCWSPCDKDCKTRYRSQGGCAAVCGEGCSCVEGYLRHENGTCVPVDQCSPPKCNDDEEYSSCGTACPTSCDNYNNTCIACILVCVDGCFCKPGTIRASDNDLTCIVPEKCPPKNCPGQNEYFEWCPPTCPTTQNCSNIWSKFDCSNAPDCCEPKCWCNDGYYRGKDGTCISFEECIAEN